MDLPGDEEFVVCSVCGAKQSANRNMIFSIRPVTPFIVFENKPFVTHSRKDLFGSHALFDASRAAETEEGKNKKKEQAKGAGATIKERCPKCGHPEMTFHTMQLRSADEGQTVFYTCPKCEYTQFIIIRIY